MPVITPDRNVISWAAAGPASSTRPQAITAARIHFIVICRVLDVVRALRDIGIGRCNDIGAPSAVSGRAGARDAGRLEHGVSDFSAPDLGLQIRQGRPGGRPGRAVHRAQMRATTQRLSLAT